MGDASIGPLVITWPEENHPKPEDWIAVFNWGKRAGAEEMRERAARRAGSLFAMSEEMRDELSASAPDHEDLIAANCGVVIENAIRALPLEG